MGDVILTEPIRRYLKKKYPNSKITLMTTKSRGCDQISSYLGYDNVIFVEETEMLMDTLSKIIEDEEIVEDENGLFDVKKIEKYNFNNYQIKIDLDLSYESRLLRPYLASYFDMIGVDYKTLSQEEKLYKIYYNKNIEKNNKGIYLCGEGSGWPGKTYPYMPEIKKFLENMQQFSITEFSYQDKIEDLFDILLANNYYLGTDSGVMHIALALGLKGIVICGAAVTELTTPYVEYGFCNSIHVEEKDLSCIGCKHKMFFELLNNNQITFVSPCKHPSGQPVCMVELKPELLYDIITDKLK
jgi:ADP-heptose:LPS heptosyltransferase